MGTDVLIVEDSATQAEQLRELLVRAGHRVLAASNGEQALGLAQARRPGLVITDVVMPRMDGYTLCRRIKSDPRLRGTPVILLTSLSSPRDVIDGLACGADNFIRKPYEEAALLGRVERILSDRERPRAAVAAGLEVSYGGERHVVTAAREQVLDFLFSTFEETVQLDGELARSYRSLDWLYRLAEGLNRRAGAAEVTSEALERALELADGAWIVIGDRLVGARGTCRWLADPADAPPANAEVALRSGERVLGAMNLLGALDDEHLRTLEAAGHQVGVALERALLQENLERRVQERTAALSAEVAARQRAEKALRALVAIVESADDAIVRQAPHGVIETWNPGAERTYGYAADEVLGGSIDVLVPPDRREEMSRLLRRVAGGESVQGQETVRIGADGRRIDVSLTLSPVRDAGGAVVGVAEIARDVTRAKQLELELMQAQRLESVGRLAGGIAHDFNNLMMAVIGFSDLALADLPPDSPIRGEIEEIRSAGDRATALTQRLLAFGRKQVLRPEVLDFNATMREMQALLVRLLGEDVRLVTRLAPDPWPVKADRRQLEQVVMNLAVNARDAMPDGGTLTIETANVALDGRGPCALLTVSDTGIGMDAETATHIFEPFFTTKEEGRGTGLGLSTVFGIVKQNGGEVTVTAAPQSGATFRVYLPRTDEPSPAPAEGSALAQPVGGAETIVVVEDDENVRSLLRVVLERGGHPVLCAEGGDSALALVDGLSRPPDLLITDMVMPDMSGRQLVERIRLRWPGTRVLYISGHTTDTMIQRGLLEPGARFMSKPFTPQQLLEMVRTVLDEAPTLSRGA
jgi:PAS domain S-box-containing protein